MSLKKSLIVLGFAVLFIGKAHPYDNLGSSVIATGMGGAFVATANDPSGIFYNPAGLAQINQYTFYGMYNRQTTFGYFLDEKPYALATAGALPFSQGVLGLGISQKGSWFKETQVVAHNTVALGFARFVSPNISLGANAKFLFNTNYGDKTGADFDLGLLYFATPQLTLGLVGENLAGIDVLPDNLGTYYLYNRRQVKLGMAYEIINGEYRTRFGFDTIFKEKKGLVTDGNNLNNFGIQQSLPFSSNSQVSFRAGYSLGKDYNQDFNSYALGISYELYSGNNIYRFDYSYQDYPFESSESFAGDNRLALTVAFGAPKNGNGFAQQEEKLNLAVANKSEKAKVVPEETKIQPEKKQAKTEKEQVDKSAFKVKKESDNLWEAPADTKREQRLSEEIDKSPSLSSAQVKPEQSKATSQKTAQAKPEDNQTASKPAAPEGNKTTSPALAQLTPAENQLMAKPVPGSIFAGLKITSRTESYQAKSKKDKSYLFIFKYSLEEEQRYVSEWKLLISSSPSKSFLTQGSDPAILQTINGRGIPPSAVIWDAKDKTGTRVVPGKYYYTMYLKSNQGEKFLSIWNPLLVE